MDDAGTDRARILDNAAARPVYKPADDNDTSHKPDCRVQPLRRCDKRRGGLDPGRLSATQAGFCQWYPPAPATDSP